MNWRIWIENGFARGVPLMRSQTPRWSMSMARSRSAWRKANRSRSASSSKRGEPGGDVGGHVLGGGHPGRLFRSEQAGQLGHVAAVAEAGAGRVGEGGRPAGEPVLPVRVRRAINQPRDGQVSGLVHDPAPGLAGFPPAVVAGVGPHHQEQAQEHARDLIRADRHADIDVLVAVHLVNRQREEAEGQHVQHEPGSDRPANADRLAPEHPGIPDHVRSSEGGRRMDRRVSGRSLSVERESEVGCDLRSVAVRGSTPICALPWLESVGSWSLSDAEGSERPRSPKRVGLRIRSCPLSRGWLGLSVDSYSSSSPGLGLGAGRRLGPPRSGRGRPLGMGRRGPEDSPVSSPMILRGGRAEPWSAAGPAGRGGF